MQKMYMFREQPRSTNSLTSKKSSMKSCYNFQQNRKANLEALEDVQLGHETRQDVLMLARAKPSLTGSMPKKDQG